MNYIITLLKEPWPWYISGPLIGLTVPILLITSNKQFGVSSVLRHICSASNISKNKYFNYNLKDHYWNMLFVLGILMAGFFAFNIININLGELSNEGKIYFTTRNVEISGIFPTSYISYQNIFSLFGLTITAGGFFIGFGSRYAGGCTSGHAITGVSLLSAGSMIASACFFIGGLIGTYLIVDQVL